MRKYACVQVPNTVWSTFCPCSHTPFFRLRALVCFGVCLQSVCSLLCCSVRDCRGYFIKVHLLACLRPNHPPSKSHLHQTLGILWPFLLLTLYCNSPQRGSVRQQKHVSGGDAAFSIRQILIKIINAEVNPDMIFPGTPTLHTAICVFSRLCGFDKQTANPKLMFLVIKTIGVLL